MALRGIALRRDHVVAASLAAAVVVVVGYASGLGLRPGSVANAGSPPPTADGPAPSAPAGDQPAPPGGLPSVAAIPPLPAQPVGGAPSDVTPVDMPANMPGDVVAQPTPTPPSDPGFPAPSEPAPPGTTTPPVLPPGTDLPACTPGLPQQALDAVSGLPLVGGVTIGLGLSGPDGLGALVLGYCRAADGSPRLAMVPKPTSGLLGGG
ncbi:MAG TPA: hypothetical protein VGH57_30145 [Amycolatopsis sp.]